ncbi:hypothetical protein U9M48_001166 [Paspalum notatum var. saurae]|uniref:Retrotransposon gag domain-containing protein n=1 Tax=Paspalum notatum var. saurae TaxID=547442 RepID=A0AAQ3PEL1_PASNO
MGHSFLMNWLLWSLSKVKSSTCSFKSNNGATRKRSCLHGPSGAWCASFLAMQPAGHQVTWDEFRAAFRAHYLPPSLIELKQREFRALRQGNMSVLDYVQAFIRLSQYSPEDVDTDPHRATRLLDGFDPTLLTHLGRSYDNFT